MPPKLLSVESCRPNGPAWRGLLARSFRGEVPPTPNLQVSSTSIRKAPPSAVHWESARRSALGVENTVLASQVTRGKDIELGPGSEKASAELQFEKGCSRIYGFGEDLENRPLAKKSFEHSQTSQTCIKHSSSPPKVRYTPQKPRRLFPGLRCTSRWLLLEHRHPAPLSLGPRRMVDRPPGRHRQGVPRGSEGPERIGPAARLQVLHGSRASA